MNEGQACDQKCRMVLNTKVMHLFSSILDYDIKGDDFYGEATITTGSSSGSTTPPSGDTGMDENERGHTNFSDIINEVVSHGYSR